MEGIQHNELEDVGMHPGASANQTNIAADLDSPIYTNTDIRLPQRKNIRAEFHDYSGGDYFITICTREKEHYFGKIVKGTMHLSKIGKFAYLALESLHTHYSYVEVPLFVVMPNHVHAIICIRESTDAPGCIPTIRTALGIVVGGYKQSVTRFARRNNIDFGWQSRYHDRIIRNRNECNMIAEYIENNVFRWDADCFNMEK